MNSGAEFLFNFPVIGNLSKVVGSTERIRQTSNPDKPGKPKEL